MKQLVRNYKPDPLQELIQMGRDVRNDAETAMYRQTRFFRELEAWGFFEQPGFEHLQAEMAELKKTRDRYDNMMDRILKHLRELNDAMIEAEKMLLTSTNSPSDEVASSLFAIDQMLASIEGDASTTGESK